MVGSCLESPGCVKFSLHYASSSYKEGGFTSVRQKNIRDAILKEYVEIWRKVQSTALIVDETRCDVSGSGFWSAGQVAFLDIRVPNPSANRYKTKASQTSAYDACGRTHQPLYIRLEDPRRVI